jgi:hypothetical protein
MPHHRESALSDHFYFHTSGQIICRPAATEQDVTDLLTLARQIAATTNIRARAGVLRATIAVFYEAAANDALCPAGDLAQLRSIRDEAEVCWVDAAWERLFAAAQLTDTAGPPLAPRGPDETAATLG